MSGLVEATTGAAAIDVVALSYGAEAGIGSRGRACDTIRVHAPCTLVVRFAAQPATQEYELVFDAAFAAYEGPPVAMIWGTGKGTTDAIRLDLVWK